MGAGDRNPEGWTPGLFRVGSPSDSLNLTIMEIFIPWKWADATTQPRDTCLPETTVYHAHEHWTQNMEPMGAGGGEELRWSQRMTMDREPPGQGREAKVTQGTGK